MGDTPAKHDAACWRDMARSYMRLKNDLAADVAVLKDQLTASTAKVSALQDRVKELEAELESARNGCEDAFMQGATHFKLVFGPEDGDSRWPEGMVNKPFCKISLFHDSGDGSVGISPRTFLQLEENQPEDTWLGQFLATMR